MPMPSIPKLRMLLEKFPELLQAGKGLARETSGKMATEGVPLFAALALSNKIAGHEGAGEGHDMEHDADYDDTLKELRSRHPRMRGMQPPAGEY